MDNIVINALQYRPDGSGIAVMMRELFGPFTALCRRSVRIVLPKASPAFPCGEKTTVTYAPCTYEQGLRRVLFQSLVLGRRYGKNAALLTVDSKAPLLLPKSCTLLPIVTDLALYRLPEAYQSSRVLLWKLQYRRIRRRAAHYFAISEFTKREMTALLGIPPERIHVIPCAAPDTAEQVTDEAALRAVKEKYRLPAPYILFVGNFNPRKNLERLIRAFDRMKEETRLPHELVIAGARGWKFSAAGALEGIKHPEAVRFIGYVPDEDMPALYSAAELFAFPTLYEGFGIPVIEAQKCGVPVLTSSVSALPETGGDGAYYADPYDEASIAGAMARLLTDRDLRWELAEKGRKNAERFSWTVSARKLSECIEEVLAP